MSWYNNGLSRRLYSGYLPVTTSSRIEYCFKSTEKKQDSPKSKKCPSTTKPKAIGQRKPICSKTQKATTPRKRKSAAVPSGPPSKQTKNETNTQQPVNDKEKSLISETASTHSTVTAENFI